VTLTGSSILYANADDTFQLRIQTDNFGTGAYDVWELQRAYVLLDERVDDRGIHVTALGKRATQLQRRNIFCEGFFVPFWRVCEGDGHEVGSTAAT
jgi:hypothetical protein